MRILLVGCGKMGGAMLRGWLDRGIEASGIQVIEPMPEAAAAARSLGVAVVEAGAASAPEVVVIAVKPQAMAAAAPPLARFAEAGPLYLSIAAGTPIRRFEEFYGAAAAVVRAMPNTPAAIGRGMQVACPNGNVTPP